MNASTWPKLVCLILLVFLPVAGLRADEGERLGMMLKIVGKTDNPAVQVSILRGILNGLAGRREVPAPDGWAALNAKLKDSNDGKLRKLMQQLGQIFGDKAASQAALATLRDPKAALSARRQALKSLLSQQNADVLPELEKLLDQPLHLDAIRAYGAFDHKPAPEILLKHYATFDSAAKRAVVETLATRKAYARALLAALKRGTVTKAEVPAYAARTMANLLGDSFTAVYGDVQAISADKTELIASYKAKLGNAAFAKADASRGRAVYQQTCAACHKMYDAGGAIGPDLTGSNRADRDYILLNILDPSFDVPEGYRMVTITTKSGQVLVGNVAEEDQSKVVLKMVGLTNTVLKADIKSRQVSNISMMPEGLLAALSDSQFFDLITYLQTEKQVELPK